MTLAAKYCSPSPHMQLTPSPQIAILKRIPGTVQQASPAQTCM